MDAILAVSALAMALAVDWVISCCGVSSEAMFQMLDGLIMVRSGKTGGGHKTVYISGTVGQIYFKIWHSIADGAPYH